MKKSLLCFVLLLASVLCKAGDNKTTDSLRIVLKTASGNHRVDILNKLIKQIYKNETPQARQYLVEAEKLSENYPVGKVGVLINKGRIVFFETRDDRKALDHYLEALELAEELNYTDGLLILYSAVGNTYRDLGDMKSAKETFDRGLKKAEEQKNILLRAKLLNNTGVMEYYKGNLDGAMDYFKKSVAEYEKLKDVEEIAGITMNMGIMLYRTGKNRESLDYYEKALKLMYQVKDTLNIANALTNIAITQSSLGKNEEAIKRYFEAEKIYIAQKDQKGLSGCYDNIGSSYSSLGKDDLALKFFLKSLKIRETEKDERGLIHSYLNIGDIYESMRDTVKALKGYYKAKDIAKKMGDEYLYAHILKSIASCYYNQGKLSEAEKLLNESMEISKRINDVPGLASVYISIGNVYKKKNDSDKALQFYKDALEIKQRMGEKVAIAGLLNNIGVIYYDKKKFRESIKYYEKALALRKEIKNPLGISDSYLSLSNAYAETNDFKNAYKFHVVYHKTWDSLYNSRISEQIAEMNTKYESAKKDQEILKRTAGEKEAKAIAEKEALESRSANQRFIYLAIGFVLVLILAGYTYKANLQRKKANELLARSNQLLASSNDEIMSQKFEITMQKHLVEEKQKEIIDSISYAKRLQEAILPPLTLIKKHLPDSFVMYRPKDIVAGDFYWMEANANHVLIAAADCTGHGVPGAMVSVVCSNALNRAVKEFGIEDPGKILDKVRELVVETFGKSESEVKDGMDISLCAFTKSGIQWAGANNPLWYFQNGEMKKIVPDKQPIGKTDKPQPFTTHNVKLNKGDVVYLFTDGFADQFGGPAGKKFKTKQMEELFVATVSEKMEIQEQNIQSEFEKWKGRLEQIDDVCIIGIRV